MANTIDLTSYAELIGTNGLFKIGSKQTPANVPLNNNEILDVQWTVAAGATEVFWDTAVSPGATPLEIIVALSNADNVYLKLTGTLAADYNYLMLKSNLAQVAGGKVLSYALGAEVNITKIEIVNKDAGPAIVRVLAG